MGIINVFGCKEASTNNAILEELDQLRLSTGAISNEEIDAVFCAVFDKE